MALPAIIPALGPAVLAAGAGMFGGERANRINQREAAKNRAFQSAEAAVNRDFQERMRNTEWQAAVADMQAAGINPAVAYARGGASSPSGSTAGGSSTAPATDSVGSAMAALAMRKQLHLLDAQISKTRSEASTAEAEASIRFRDQQMANQKYDFYFGPDGRPRGPLLELLRAEHASSLANSARSVSEADLAAFSVPERKAVAELFTRFGEGGKAMQLLLPLLMNISAGYARGR